LYRKGTIVILTLERSNTKTPIRYGWVFLHTKMRYRLCCASVNSGEGEQPEEEKPSAPDTSWNKKKKISHSERSIVSDHLSTHALAVTIL